MTNANSGAFSTFAYSLFISLFSQLSTHPHRNGSFVFSAIVF